MTATLSLLRDGKLTGSKRLDLGCGLTDFPEEIFTLADSLEVLNLSGNALSTLPDDLSRLYKLRVIFCSDNQFVELPEVLGRCPRLEMIGFKANRISHVPPAALPPGLRWLILTDNQIAELPAELGACVVLQKCMLAGNRLRQLPQQMANCKSLELLRISANRFEQLPDWLWTLPRLAWLAFAGNPCSDGFEAAPGASQVVAKVDWGQLELKHCLGEGASGVIHHAQYRQQSGDTAVAVKVFKGDVTSDGLPRSEMAACIKAGAHPGLIPFVGVVTGHPLEAQALVMALINPEFVNLSAPPSLESCTRDCYEENIRFSAVGVMQIALKISAVAAHLHAQGLMHGDLYAHNILWDQHDDCLLGDFGAATMLSPHDEAVGLRMQRIEVRAFACLLEELLDRLIEPQQATQVVDALRAMQRRSADPDVNMRPLFEQLQSELKSLQG